MCGALPPLIKKSSCICAYISNGEVSTPASNSGSLRLGDRLNGHISREFQFTQVVTSLLKCSSTSI
jgi:hypothetical protein